MKNIKMIVNKETWNMLPGEEREWILYNTLYELDTRLSRIENKSIINKTLAFLGGICGGIAGFFGSKMFNN